MNRSTTTNVLALAALSTALMLSACDRKPAAAPSPASAAPSPTAPPVDWAKVQPSTPGEGIMTEKTIARYCDAWHKGGKPRITLRHDGRTTLSDDAGNTMTVTPQQWKSIIQQVRSAKRPTPAAASKSAMYSNGGPAPQDTFGVLPRYMYTIEIIDDTSAVFRTDRKLDDGT